MSGKFTPPPLETRVIGEGVGAQLAGLFSIPWKDWFSKLASLLNFFQPNIGSGKRVDLSRATTITLANDPDLTINFLANTAYEVECGLFVYHGGGGLNLQFLLNTSGATALTGSGLFFNSFTGLVITFLGPGNAVLIPAANLSTNPAARTYLLFKFMFLSGTAGSLTLQWSQNTSNASPSVVSRASYLRAIQTS